jgi:hypothetical protein
LDLIPQKWEARRAQIGPWLCRKELVTW